MKKIAALLLILFLNTFIPALADDNLNPAGNVEVLPDKYIIIKTTSNYTPVREAANINARRFSHLKKGIKVFADKEENDYYRIDLGLDKYYWIEKKYADVDSVADNKELSSIKNIKIFEDSKFYTVKINLPYAPPYNEIETSSNSLDFILYDTVIDMENLNLEVLTGADFKISKDEFENLKISYSSNYPLTGHAVIQNGDSLYLKVKKPYKISKRKPLKNITVVIDPGHGGADSGACAFNLKEKDINLMISEKLKKQIEHQGANAYLTREDDIDVDLYDRVDFAKEKEADFLISIHQNSLPNPKNVDKKHGAGVYYYNKEAYLLAKEVQNSLTKETGFRDDGVNFASFALTRSADPVCILVECGYIIHPEESEKLANPTFQKIVSDAIINGIKNYLKNNF